MCLARSAFPSLVGCVLLASCAAPGPTVRDTYAPLYRSAISLQTATSVGGISHVAFRTRLEALATEVLVAKGLASTAEEKAIVAAYAEVLEAYLDSAAVWDEQITQREEGPALARALNDRPVVTEELWPLVEKYDLPIENIENLGSEIPTVPSDSVQRVWQVANERAAKAADLYLAAIK